ncbi:hypothetical protein ILYODFUR_009700 [Ilyodon furcidens]|uniref:Uncharacterized protein n=1 Tax=Ilyodon furcidens TaxID=33524 RepID=A0ABV0TLC9_9TELE
MKLRSNLGKALSFHWLEAFYQIPSGPRRKAASLSCFTHSVIVPAVFLSQSLTLKHAANSKRQCLHADHLNREDRCRSLLVLLCLHSHHHRLALKTTQMSNLQ